MHEYIKEVEITKKRTNWITKISEYDTEFKPTKVVHRRGLCKYMAQELTSEEGKEQSEQVLIN